MKAAGVAVRLIELGFDETDPSTWGAMAKLSDSDLEDLDGYKAALIVAMTRSWSFGDEVSGEKALDLPSAVFTALSDACGAEFNKATDFSPDGVTDPKADTAD
jgi:hypothetical protein